METNREVKIAIIVGLIMVTACIVAFIIAKNKNNPNVTLDVHIYKHVVTGEDGSGKYFECSIPTDSLLDINNDFKRIMNLKDSNKVRELSANIEGTYKIASGSNFIAFDADGKNYVYRSDSTAIYSYSTETYKKVAELCSYITRDSVAASEENTTTEEETTETKKETKKETSTKKKTSTTKKTSKK
ncbi:MAG: hypothetical protein II625_04415 [Bacilli bacterium]|nr:hypothetical protein [Bacilli bacterium]